MRRQLYMVETTTWPTPADMQQINTWEDFDYSKRCLAVTGSLYIWTLTSLQYVLQPICGRLLPSVPLPWRLLGLLQLHGHE